MSKPHVSSRRAIGYIRVSTDQQRDSGLGLEAQRASLDETAARLGLTLAAIHTDAGLGGSLSIEQRPALMDALNDLRRGDVLLVAKRDRLSRGDALQSALIERAIAATGARVVSGAGEGTQDDDPTSVFTRRVLDAVAELERAMIAARTRAALRAKRARGERAGTEPYGYRVIGDTQTLAAHAPEQHILATIAECRAAGYPLRATAEELNRMELRTRTGAPWRHTNVASILATVARHAPAASR